MNYDVLMLFIHLNYVLNVSEETINVNHQHSQVEKELIKKPGRK